MEEDDDIEYSGSNDEVDDDMASSNGPSTRDLDNIDLGEMVIDTAIRYLPRILLMVFI